MENKLDNIQSNQAKTTGNWIRHNIIFVVPITLLISYAVILYLPPQYSWFERQRNLMAIGQVIIGFVEFPLRLIFLFLSGAPGVFMGIIAFIYFIFAGFGVGKGMQLLWKKGWMGRAGLVLVFLANCGFGLFMLAWSDTLVSAKPSQTCEKFISPENGLRIVEFDEVGILPGVQFFYLFTHDGGKTWDQLMTVRHDDPTDPDCSTIASLNNGFIWVWSGFGVRTTIDNGKTWTEWNWECCTYGAVEKVEFQNSAHGTMNVFKWQSEISELFTADGGKTWTPKR